MPYGQKIRSLLHTHYHCVCFPLTVLRWRDNISYEGLVLLSLTANSLT